MPKKSKNNYWTCITTSNWTLHGDYFASESSNCQIMNTVCILWVQSGGGVWTAIASQFIQRMVIWWLFKYSNNLLIFHAANLQQPPPPETQHTHTHCSITAWWGDCICLTLHHFRIKFVFTGRLQNQKGLYLCPSAQATRCHNINTGHYNPQGTEIFRPEPSVLLHKSCGK